MGDLIESVDLSSRPALAGGHRWMRCSSCRRWAVALDAGGKCRQTPAVAKASADGITTYSCPGRLGLVVAIAKGKDEACSRGGCRNVASQSTWQGQRLCQRCWWGLALLGVG